MPSRAHDTPLRLVVVPRPLHSGRRTPGRSEAPIPAGWAARHAPVIASTLDCEITIGPDAEIMTFNEATGRTEATPAPSVYAGPASISIASTGGTSEPQRVDAADDQIDVRAYRIRIPAGTTASIEVDHVLTVVRTPSGALDGSRLRVTGASEPGREFSRLLTARLYD